jgi:hexokinase
MGGGGDFNAIRKSEAIFYFNIEVSAILNDTTGCLLACAYKRPDCAMGVIIGTGRAHSQQLKGLSLEILFTC